MGDGGFINLREVSHPIVDESAITLGTAQKALWAPALTMIPANYWRPGRTIRVTAFGKATTDGTAGNYVFGVGYGAGDAPTPTVSGATVAGTVSQTNISWTAWAIIECRSRGATGTVRMFGEWRPAVALLASTLQPYTFPSSAPADSTIDTTVATNAITFQLQRSGAGVWTATTTNVILEELN